MKTIIDNAINELKIKGIEPVIINLSEKDYNEFIQEVNLTVSTSKDYMDGYVKELKFYRNIEIDHRLCRKDESRSLSQSYIASKKLMGRIFNIRTLKEGNY